MAILAWSQHYGLQCLPARVAALYHITCCGIQFSAFNDSSRPGRSTCLSAPQIQYSRCAGLFILLRLLAANNSRIFESIVFIALGTLTNRIVL